MIDITLTPPDPDTMRITPSFPASALFFVLAMGCGYGSTSPDRYGAPALAGRYVLESAGGHPAPALILARTDPASQLPIEGRVTDDTLVIDTTGHYDQLALLVTTLGGEPLGRPRWSDHGVVTNAGGVLTFVSNAHEGVTFSGFFHEDARLDITQSLLTEEGDAALFVLRRVP